MQMTPMLDKLNRYYKEEGISALDFKCKHESACKACCKAGDMINTTEAYVGEGYEKGKVPRLLFISSDINNASWLKDNPKWCTLLEARKRIMRDRNKNFNSKSHWYQTLKLTQTILDWYSSNRLAGEIKGTDYFGYFAHTRSTRCKDEGIGSKEGSPVMARNCYGYLKREIEIMRPDIIITQGRRARNSLWNVFPVIKTMSMQDYPVSFYEIIKISDTHKAIKIVAKHPCARGRNGWKSGEKAAFMQWAVESVRGFIPL